MSETDRAIRQRDLVPPAELASYHCIVVGVGAIGRQVALQLAAMGAPVLDLFDGDTVGVENLAVQGYREADNFRWKVEATAELCHALHPAATVTPHPTRFTRHTLTTLRLIRPKLAVFCCVDTMAARRIVWESTKTAASFFADGRMAGESLRVLASADPLGDEHYVGTLFDDAQAHPAPCTGRSTLYAASIAAGLMLVRFAMHLRNHPLPADTLLNLLADELVSLGP